MSPVIPIAAVDITAVAEQSARAAAWVAKVLQERKRKEERCAALILRELGMLVTAGYALNNAGRAVTAPLVPL